MMFLKQSTASQSVLIGPFVDSTDGNTAETGLTIDAADIRLSKNGANIVAKNSGGGTHDELGYYTITLDATDTDTVGRLQLMVHETGALPVYHEFWVLEEAIYDALFAASANAFAGAAGSTTLTALASGSITAAVIADNAIDAGALAADCITAAKIANGAIDAATFAADVDAEILSYIVDDATRIDASALNTAAVTTIPAILDDTDDIGVAGAGLTAVPWNAAWDAEVQSEVQDAIEVNNLDHLLKVPLTAEFNTIADPDSIIGYMTHNDVGTGSGTLEGGYNRTTDSLEALRLTLDGLTVGAGPTAVQIRQEIDSNSTQLAAILADTNELQTDWVNGGRLDLLIDAIKAKTDSLTFTIAGHVNANVLYIASNSGSSSALNRLFASTVLGIADAAATTTSIPTSSLSPAAAVTSQFVGRYIVFDRDTATAALRGQAARITASTAGGTLTVTALTTAPASGDSFVIHGPYDSGLSTHSAAEVWTSGTRTLTALDEDSTTLDLDATIRAAVGLASANLDTQLDALPTAAENAAAVLTTAMTESYRGTGATATLAQACYEIIAHMGESSISGTTKTLKKLDGSTAKTYTLDSATAPTSITETS